MLLEYITFIMAVCRHIKRKDEWQHTYQPLHLHFCEIWKSQNLTHRNYIAYSTYGVSLLPPFYNSQSQNKSRTFN